MNDKRATELKEIQDKILRLQTIEELIDDLRVVNYVDILQKRSGNTMVASISLDPGQYHYPRLGRIRDLHPDKEELYSNIEEATREYITEIQGIVERYKVAAYEELQGVVLPPLVPVSDESK